MGEGRVLSGGEVAEAREAYLARHARAAYWVDFDDFSFWRLDVADVYFVGGFAAMDWVTAARIARRGRILWPTPLPHSRPHEPRSRRRADRLRRHFAGEAADEATMTAVDRLGFGSGFAAANGCTACGSRFPAR